jgi:hypothetical protein
MQVYKIGVELMMLGNFTGAISALGRNLLGINSKVKELQGSFNGLKGAIVGALSAYAGVKTLEFLGDMVKHGNEIVHQQELMRAAGMSQQEIAEATAKAYETSAKVQTTTISDNLKHLRELRYAFGDLAKAQAAIDQVSQANAVLQNVAGPGAGDQVWDFVKSLEIKNVTTDPELFHDYIDKMVQVVLASGAKVTPRQFFSTFKYGRTAMQGWDQEFITGALPRLIQSMSGGAGGGSGGSGGPGNALQSMFAEVVSGQMTKTAAGEFANLGIGEVKNIKGSAKSQVEVKNKNLMITNPYEWVQQVLMPAFHEKGWDKTNEDIIAHIGKMFPNRTAGQVVSEFATQGRYHEGAQSQFEKDIALQKQPMGAQEGFQSLLNNDLNMQMKAFTAQWNSMLEALGSPLVPTAIEVMKKFTGVFTDVAQFAQVHPDAIVNIAKGIGTLAAALTGAGIVGILAFVGPVGWFVGGIAALGAAVALWGPKILDYMGPQGRLLHGLINLGTALAGYEWKAGFANLVSGLQSLWDKLKGFFGQGPQDNTLPPGFAPGAYHGGGQFMPINYETGDTAGPGDSAGPAGSSSTGGEAVGRRLMGSSSPTGGGAGNGLRMNAPMGNGAAMGAGDSVPVPAAVLSQAANVLRSSGTGALQRFMAAQGYPKSGNWCGEFAAAVVRSAGGTPPSGAAVASAAYRRRRGAQRRSDRQHRLACRVCCWSRPAAGHIPARGRQSRSRDHHATPWPILFPTWNGN